MLTQQEKQTIIDEVTADLEKTQYRKLVEEALIQTEEGKIDEVKADLVKVTISNTPPTTKDPKGDSQKILSGN